MPKKYEVIISGIGSTFPECNNLDELQEKVLMGKNLLNNNIKVYKDDVERYCGNIPDWGDFDNRFFQIHDKLNMIMDVSLKHLLKKSFSAICDAGINPVSLQGSNTLVITASQTGDIEMSNTMYIKKHPHTMLALAKAMMANRVSYFFSFTGPSYTLDSAWTGGMNAIEIATKMISMGLVKQALIGIAHVLIIPKTNFIYDDCGFNFLTKSNSTNSFSDDADGFNRADGVVALFLQRAEDSMRSYGTIEKVLTESRSSLQLGSFSKHIVLNDFLKDFYENSNIDPNDIAYMECDGSAIPEVDKAELNAIDEVICKKRNSPLLIGSCKSIMGHTQGASSGQGLINAIIALRTGYIPPTINYVPNTKIKSLVEGRLKIVCEKTPLEGDLVAVNSIGLCSNFGHIVIRRTKITKRPKEITESRDAAIPKIILMSGRDGLFVEKILDELVKGPVDDGTIAFFHNIFKMKIPNYLFRGYAILEEGETPIVDKCDVPETPPIWYVFSGMGSQWPEMGRDLLKFHVAAESLRRSHDILATKGLNLMNIITTTDTTIFDNILNSFVGITSIQVALVDLLSSIGITPDGIIGHSVGELGCAYADGCLTAEEAVLSSYARGKASLEADLIEGMMAAVGLGYEQIKDQLPPEIEVACHNSSTNCTISGPVEDMKTFTNSLKENGIFVRLVNVSNIAYHSRYIAPAGTYLLRYLKEIIRTPKLRSSKWISSSVPEDKWDTEEAKYCSAEYQTNNLLNSVLFEEACKHVSENGTHIEIAPHGLLQGILKKSLKKGLNVSLTNQLQKDGVKFLLKSLGNIFIAGASMDLMKLYPKYEFPVPVSTRSFQPFISWQDTFSNEIFNAGELADHKLLTNYKVLDDDIREFEAIVKNKYFIKNKQCMPAALVIELCTDFFINLTSKEPLIRLVDAVFDPVMELKNLKVGGITCQLLTSNNFEIGNYDIHVLSGRFLEAPIKLPTEEELVCDIKEFDIHCDVEEISYRLIECGLNLSCTFKIIKDIHISDKGFCAKVKATKELFFVLDAIFTLLTFYNLHETGKIHMIRGIREMIVNKTLLVEDEELTVVYNKCLSEISCKCIKITGYKTSIFNIENKSVSIDLKEPMFLPFSKDLKLKAYEFYSACAQFIDADAQFQRNNTLNLIDLSDNIEIPKEFQNAMEKSSKAKVRQFFKTSLGQLQKESESINLSHCSVICYGGAKLPSKILEALKSTDSYILFFTNSKGELEINNMAIVFEQTLNKKRIVLLKKTSLKAPNSNIINMEEINWKMSLTEKLKKTSEPVFLIMSYQSLSDIYKINESLLQFKKESNLRYVYIDSTSPEFSIANSFYKDQLQKGFKINICRNGIWGFLSSLPLDENKFLSSKDAIKSIDVNLKFVAVNLNDPEQTSDDQFNVVEYSGIKDKEEIFGISTLMEDNCLEIDPILNWKKPKEWSYEEAATVPLFYSLAYYLVVVKACMSPKGRIMVLSGHTNLGQAIIRVALSVGSTVFTTYETKEEKSVIQQLFPMINESNILCTESYSFSKTVMELTNDFGVNVLVNTSNDTTKTEMFLSIMGEGSLGGRTYFFVLAKGLMEENLKMGMSAFFKSLSMYGLGLHSVITFDDALKKELVEAVNNGIKTGIVKPLTYNIIKEDPTIKGITESIKDSKKIPPPNKVVLNVEQKTNWKYHNENSCIIIGNYSNLFLSLLRWITPKNPGEIHLVTDKDQTPLFITRRANSARRRHTTFHLQSTTILKSSTEFGAFLEKINKKKDIQKVFLFTNGLEKDLEKIELALKEHTKNVHLIAIGNNADEITTRRQRDGLKSAAILYNLYDCKAFHNALNLVSQTHVNNTMIISHDKVTNDQESFSESQLPATLEELINIGECITNKPCFYELKSRSPSYMFAKDCNPVFLIPGLHVDKLKKMGSSSIYPVFMADLPPNETSLENLAISLAKELVSNFNISLYNIICEGWSGPLALLLAKQLELKGKLCNIFLIDVTPFTSRDWSKTVSMADIVLKYFNTTKDAVSNSTKWEDIGRIIEQKSDLRKEEVLKVIESFKIVVNKMSMVKDFDYKNLVISSNLVLYLLDNTPDEEVDKLITICKGFTVYRKPGCFDHSGLLENSVVINEIDQMCLYEVSNKINKNCIRAQTTLVDSKRLSSIVSLFFT